MSYHNELQAARRRLVASDVSDESAISATLQFDIQATNRLSEILDQQRSDVIEMGTQTKGQPSSIVLQRLLSLRSEISTSSSFAIFNQSMQNEKTGYRKIGFGQCGLVFERPGRSFVLKLSRPAFDDALWNDCLCHFLVYQAFAKQSAECRVPMIYSYVSKANTQWWEANRPYLPETADDFPLPTMALITEHILPLPRIIRHALIEQFCPKRLKESVISNPADRDCLVRVYLGRRRQQNMPPPPNFSLRNYNLCLDQMISLGLPIKTYATGIAEALALVHWSAYMDGYDVEFVLGSEAAVNYTQPIFDCLSLNVHQFTQLAPHTDLDTLIRANFQKRTTRMWLLDFNLCNRWSEEVVLEYPDAVINQLVLAFFENDPYYPLPLMELDVDKELWSLFRKEYLRKSDEVLRSSVNYQKLHQLPTSFIEACVAREQSKLEQGKGHGHRDLKA